MPVKVLGSGWAGGIKEAMGQTDLLTLACDLGREACTGIIPDLKWCPTFIFAFRPFANLPNG
jgi:hypothetical protein